MNQLVRLTQTLSQSVARTVTEWPVASQQQARRNAMLAVNACAVRRAEREDVASFLAARTARTAGAEGSQAHA